MQSSEKTAWVVEQARALGMDLCGVAPAEDLPELAHLDEWLARGYAGEMRYLHDARRRSPAAAMPGAQSIVVCALNYNSPQPYSTECGPDFVGAQHACPEPAEWAAPADVPRGWISRYAWGDDYHEVLGEKLDQLLAAMRKQFGEEFTARAYVDTGPVVERVAAKYAGLGWLAKNTCFINEQLGSWLFLGVILTSLELAPSLAPNDSPPPDLCGNCSLCLDACPTGALVEPYLLDARRCISYLTIELRGPIPEEFRAPMGRMVFGCDICQDVCPWNRKAPATPLAAFQPRVFENQKTENGKLPPAGTVGAQHAAPLQKPSFATGQTSLFAPELEWLASLTEEQFREIFRSSAVKRTKWRGLVRNACIALGNAVAHLAEDSLARQRIIALLESLAASETSVIADAAKWALCGPSGSNP
ncbi:MAG: tRNA epoxyqueuosine(34) reductase QueG [Acidobacteria bacterium]|nr:tRNA epoxyqueuosine(34) reductase QueG [Acidobacteriota bacterium]MCL5288195.1 tRNA epoxyqueuosine(34) reductase QueG [Acidobacteriota bacterium]